MIDDPLPFQDDFFADTAVFRVLSHFIAQFGIPGDLSLAAKWEHPIPDDPSTGHRFKLGSIAFAGSGPDSRSRQLFFCLTTRVVPCGLLG